MSSVQGTPSTRARSSSGHDGEVILGYESLQVVMDVTVSRHVYAAKMPPLARLGSGAAHCLIAIGCDDVAPEMYSAGGGGGGGYTVGVTAASTAVVWLVVVAAGGGGLRLLRDE